MHNQEIIIGKERKGIKPKQVFRIIIQGRITKKSPTCKSFMIRDYTGTLTEEKIKNHVFKRY